MKKLVCYILIVCIVLPQLVLATSNDWLKKAYDQSHNAMGEPYSVEAEARDLFDTAQFSLGGDGESVFVRVARFMMRAVVVLAVPMIIFAGIKISLSLGDDAKLMDALKQVGYVAGGVLLALMSVMLIYLITSLTRSSLGAI